MEIKIYWSSIEYNYKKGAKMFGELKGGLVYAFVKAADAREALDKILTELEKNKTIPVEIEFISPYDEGTKWENPETSKHYLGLFEKALTCDKVIFDEASTYEN